MGWQWHQMDHMQIICTSLQTDNHASTSLFTDRMLFPSNNVKALCAMSEHCVNSWPEINKKQQKP